MASIRSRAPAKVNLSLRVGARRPDGYHEIESLMVPLSLADEVEVELGARADGIEVLGHPELETPDNLCLRAVEAFRRRVGPVEGVRIRLEKRIPTAAGLGGGSSDAAAILRILARASGIAPDDARLAAAALDVGSDVPFFLDARPAIARGRGEVLVPAPPLPDPLHLVLLHPPFEISAAEAYRALAVERGGEIPPPRPPFARMADAAAVAAMLENDLEAPLSPRYPIAFLKNALLAAGALGALMSGSGPTVFGVFGDEQAAKRGAEALAGRPDRTIGVVTAGQAHATLDPP